jgi:hypothetical protein
VIPAKEGLVILVWDPEEGGHEEAPGFRLYGLAEPYRLSKDLLRGDYGFGEVAYNSRLFGDRWEVMLWDIRVYRWPTGEEWRETIRTLLSTIITGGARVAWMGSEYLPFSDPPSLFHPEHMDGLPAWMTADGRSGIPLDPLEPWVEKCIEELPRIREFAAGLADVE